MIVFVILLLYYCIGCDNKEISNQNHITLIDVNDNPPVFDQPTYTARSVQENAGIGEQVGRFIVFSLQV